MAKKGKFPSLKSDNLVLRSIVQRSGSMAVIATETPIERWDEQRQMVVKEILLMDGCVFRGGRDHVPIVDSHDDTTVRNVLGSIQRMTIQGSELVGNPAWASTPDAQETATLVNEGHLTDFSITAQPIRSVFVQRGQIYTWSRGSVEGPAVIHEEWEPHNASICTTGADVNSVVRRSYTDLKRKVTRMDEALLATFQGLGLPEGMTDPNQILAWCAGQMAAGSAEESTEDPVMNAAPATAPAPSESATQEMPVENQKKVMCQADVETIQRAALAADAARRKEIIAACTIAKIERAEADQWCDSGISVDVARKRIIERMATQPLGSSVGTDVRVTGSSDDKFHDAVLDGLVMRSAKGAGVRRSLYAGGDKPTEGAQDFAKLNLKRIALACVERMGAPVNRMSDIEIAQLAMGNKSVARRYRVERADFQAYHTTGSFANILLDAANKTLLAAYEEAPFTWSMWARTGTPAEDLKTLYRTRFSEAPNPEEVPEGKDYPEKAMSDSKESYRVAKYGESFSVSWETVVNDDLDALSRVPAMHGNAMRRLQNKKVYEVLTSNPTMGDTYSLFSSSHASGDNTSGAAAAPSVTTLNAGFVKMMTQKGLSSDAIINVIPRYLIVPVAYSATALELVNSTSYALANGNQGIQNIYGPGGSRSLTVVVDPQLDANSSTTWYLAADPAQIDTVELTFLSGEESPVLESEWNIKNDTYLYKIRQTFGVKAIDWRGLYRNS